MKKFFIFIISLILLISCDINNKYQQDYGVIKSVEVLKRYDPIIHMNKDTYKMGVEFKDTMIYIFTDWKPIVGDTIIIYKYIPKEEVPLDDYEM